MSGSLLLVLSAALVGNDFGWRPIESGGLEYIIQVEPQLLDRIKEGFDITSHVPAEVKNIRAFRFRVGFDELPRIDEPPVLPREPEDDPYLPPLDLPPPPESPEGTNPEERPQELPDSESSQGGVEQAVFLPPESSPDPPVTTQPADETEVTDPEPPSSVLLATLAIGLMGTSAGMLYTGWTAWDYRGRYRRVLEKLPLEEQMELGVGRSGRE